MAESTLVESGFDGDLKASAKSFFFIPISAREAELQTAGGHHLSVIKKRSSFRFRIYILEKGSQGRPVVTLKNRKLLDWNARYDVEDADGHHIATFSRRGIMSFARSMWRIFDSEGQEIGDLEQREQEMSMADGIQSVAGAAGLFNPSAGAVGGILGGLFGMTSNDPPYVLTINWNDIAQFYEHKIWNSLTYLGEVQDAVINGDIHSNRNLQIVYAAAALLITTESRRYSG